MWNGEHAALTPASGTQHDKTGGLIELTPFFVMLALTALVDISAEPHAYLRCLRWPTPDLGITGMGPLLGSRLLTGTSDWDVTVAR